MPTYEYQCKACDLEFEREQRISDPPVKTCPRCKSRQVKRLISRTSFHLKGGGWYSDLYSKPGKGGKKDGEGKADTAAKGDAASKSDSGAKPEAGQSDSGAKPEAKPASDGPAKSDSGPGKKSGGSGGSKAAA
jgi:putative FmdB family regulatory protein